MDSQETANRVAESVSGHEETMVKPNTPLPQQGFQVRPQGPPPSPRNSINNGPVGPRPGPPLRRLDSRSSLGPTSGQFVQLRPYGPPRPPGGSFPPRSPQPGQLPPQNPLLPPNQRFVYSPGIRGPPPQGIGGQRPPFVINQQQQQQQQRGGNDPRFQRPDIASSQNELRRPSQESITPRQLLRNDSSLNLQRQQLLLNEDIKQPTRPRIIIEKMADINETSGELDKPEGYLQRKNIRENSENDDDDDVVMDNKKSPRHNSDGGLEGLVNGSKSPSTPKKIDDATSRPGTATIEDKREKIDEERSTPSRPISANIGNTTSQSRPPSAVNNYKEEKKEQLDDALSRPISANIDNTTLPSQSRPPSAVNNDKEEKKEQLDNELSTKESNIASLSEVKEPSSSPNTNDILDNAEQSLKTSQKTSSNNSRSVTPSHLDTPNVEQDKSRSSTPSRPEILENTEQESVNSDKSRSNTPAGLEPSGNAETKAPESKTPNKSRASTPASQIMSSPSMEKEQETAAKTSNKSRSSTPGTGMESSNNEASAESDKSSENRDKPADDVLQVKESSRPTSSLSSRSEKGSKSPKPPKSPTMLENQDKRSELISPRSPEGIKGYDNGQERTLSPTDNSPLSKSPVNNEKQIEVEKKKTSHVEDKSTTEKAIEMARKTSASISKPTSLPKTPRVKTSAKSDDEKTEKKSAERKAIQNGKTKESQLSGIPNTNGNAESPTKTKEADKRSNAGSPTKSVKSLPRTPDTPSSTAQEKKKLPMNKVQVGAAPSPNLKTVRSKIGSLENASYKPGGGKVKIENRKLDFSKAQPKIAAKNEKYTPSGGDKKIAQVKLQWNAKPKVGSLENATYKPGGGDKKIETVKLDFKDKAKPKVGSKENAKHVPGGGSVKSATPPKTPQETKNDISTQKVEIKAESKIGSLDNMKHKPGGGDKKIFNDRDYLRQTSSNVESLNGSGSQIQTPVEDPHPSKTSDNDIPQPQPPPSTPTKVRSVMSPSAVVTPQAVRSGLAKSPEAKDYLTQETGNSTLANERLSKTPSPDVINISKGRSPKKSPTSPRPPSSLRVKSANEKSSPGTPRKTSPNTPNKKSPGTPRKTPSPKLRLPKIASSPIPPEPSPAVTETQTKISLPKLTEPSSQSTRIAY